MEIRQRRWVWCGLESAGLARDKDTWQAPVGGSSDDGNEPSGSITVWGRLKQMAETDVILGRTRLNRISSFVRIAARGLINNVLYVSEHYSRDRWLCSYSITSKHFIEPECSLPHSQELSTCTYPSQTNSVHTTLSLYEIHLNVIRPPTSWYS
jgi:hypothetical protein